MKSLISGIDSGKIDSLSNFEIAKKLYLTYQTFVFKDAEDDKFKITNEISKKFKIPIKSIAICGSAQTGLSFYKDSLFSPVSSDLDISIINSNLYLEILELLHQQTKAYTDLTSFKNRGDFKQLMYGINNSCFINPFLLPHSSFKSDWFVFFNKLSNHFSSKFKNINAGIYSSEYFFVAKQEACIERYFENMEKYNEISS